METRCTTKSKSRVSGSLIWVFAIALAGTLFISPAFGSETSRELRAAIGELNKLLDERELYRGSLEYQRNEYRIRELRAIIQGLEFQEREEYYAQFDRSRCRRFMGSD